MTHRKRRVLMDLSMAARGYCGIAQDARLLYKVLASSGEIEVTGLIYHPRRFAPLHRFLPSAARRGDRLANQARFLWMLSEGAVAWPNFAPLRGLAKLRQLTAAVAASDVQLDRLDVEMLGDALWRVLFSQTLLPEDRRLVQGAGFLLSNLSDGMIYARAFLNRRPFQLDTRGYDYLIVQGPRPFGTSPETRQIVRYHDMIPLSQPDTMCNPLVINWHHRAVRQCHARAVFVCNSDPSRQELTAVYPDLSARSATIPYMLADAFRPEPNPRRLQSIIDLRRSPSTACSTPRPWDDRSRYLMCVSTLEPRKNFLGLVRAFELLKSRASIERRLGDLKLVIVGSPGWKYNPILAAMRPLVQRGHLVHLEQVTADELRVLYTHAEAFVFASHSEGFGFPPLEAMQCETPVIASDIAAHRWVLGDAALYCDSYDPQSIAAAIERLIACDDSPALRSELIVRGRQRVKLYTLQRCRESWLSLLERLSRESPADDLDATLAMTGPDTVQKAA